MSEYITTEDMDRYLKFFRFQGQSMFYQIEELRNRLQKMEPPKPINIPKRQFMEKQIKHLQERVKFLESKIASLENNK